MMAQETTREVSFAKRMIKEFLVSAKAGRRILSLLAEDMPRVLVYHRFAPPGADEPRRVSADVFGWQLDTVCRTHRVMSFGELVRYFLERGKWPKKTVVITIDDGYRDMFLWAYPELHSRGLSATFFVTTGFIDGDLFLWPDRLDHAIRNTSQKGIGINLGGGAQAITLETPVQKMRAWETFSDHCVRLTDTEKEVFIAEVEQRLLHTTANWDAEMYAPCSWEEIRQMYGGGVEIGGHTCSHPILSKIDPARLDMEISRCKKSIEVHIGAEIDSFCYPNSRPGDINDEVVDAVRRAGFSGAVFGTDLFHWDRYLVPRMGVTNDRTDFLWKISGGESLTARRSASWK